MRYIIKAGARCDSSARRDLYGGRPARGVPTVILRKQRDSPLIFRPNARREKATSPSGCETHPAPVAPAGSSWSSRGSNEAAGASDVKGSFWESASVQALT